MSLNFLSGVVSGLGDAAEDAGAAAAGGGAGAITATVGPPTYSPNALAMKVGASAAQGNDAAPMVFTDAQGTTVTVKTDKPIAMSTGAKVALGVGAAIAAYLLLAD